MGVPTTEVDLTPAMPRREKHEVHKGHEVALERNVYIIWFVCYEQYWAGGKNKPFEYSPCGSHNHHHNHHHQILSLLVHHRASMNSPTHCGLQLSPWPRSTISLCFLSHPLLPFATFSSAYLSFCIPEDSNPMQCSLLLLILYVTCVQSNSIFISLSDFLLISDGRFSTVLRS